MVSKTLTVKRKVRRHNTKFQKILNIKTNINMETFKAIKPGTKPKKENGTDDRRQG